MAITTILNGAVSGEAAIYEYADTSATPNKRVLVLLRNNFKTDGAPQTFTLPTAFVNGAVAVFYGQYVGPIAFTNSSGAAVGTVISASGGNTPILHMEVLAGFTGIQFPAGMTNPWNGRVEISGA